MTLSKISVAIATHNRLEDLKVTLERLLEYGTGIHEILVCADGCNDGTQAFIKKNHSDIILLENNPGKGSIPSRNRMIRTAKAPYVLLLDDDSYPIEREFFKICEQVLRDYPEIGVLTFPQRSDEFPESLEQEDFGPNLIVGSFTSSGSIIRKELFMKLGGFPDFFFHAYEEPDYALRLHAAGYKVVQWSQLTVRHHYTQIMRNEGRTHRRHARNEMWSTLMRAPFPLVLALIPYRMFSQGRYALSRGWRWMVREPLWWFSALKGVLSALKARKPVASSFYLSWVKTIDAKIVFKEYRSTR